jgi:tetratricopeptide (TPR) repeat protein
MPLSKEAALKTLELEPDSAEGHGSLGLVRSAFEWNWASGDASFQRAIALQPGLASIHSAYATYCLLPQLRFDEACAMLERSLSLDPFNSLSRGHAVFAYANAGRYQDALRQQAFGLEFNPLFAPFFYWGGLAHEWEGHLDKAIPPLRGQWNYPATYRLLGEPWVTPSPYLAKRSRLGGYSEGSWKSRTVRSLTSPRCTWECTTRKKPCDGWKPP